MSLSSPSIVQVIEAMDFDFNFATAAQITSFITRRVQYSPGLTNTDA